jgi:muramidase (phage lysozyme)
MASRDFLESFRTTPEAQKLLAAIRFAEGTKGPGDTAYYTLYGGSKTSDLSRHPDKVIKGGKYSSAAAGAYQILPTTWNEAYEALKLGSFGKDEQDKVALYLAQRRLSPIGGLSLLKKEGLSDRVMAALAPEWASFPTLSGRSYYGQPVKSREAIRAEYQNYTPTLSNPSNVPSPAPAASRPTQSTGALSAPIFTKPDYSAIAQEIFSRALSAFAVPSAAREALSKSPASVDDALEQIERETLSPLRPKSSGFDLSGVVKAAMELIPQRIESPVAAAPTTAQPAAPQPAATDPTYGQSVLSLGSIIDPSKDPLPTTGPHLHVDVTKNGVEIDPKTWRSGLANLYVGEGKGTPLYHRMAGGAYTPSFPVTSLYGAPRPYGGHSGVDYGIDVGTPLTWRGRGQLLDKGRGVTYEDDAGNKYRVVLKHTT